MNMNLCLIITLFYRFLKQEFDARLNVVGKRIGSSPFPFHCRHVQQIGHVHPESKGRSVKVFLYPVVVPTVLHTDGLYLEHFVGHDESRRSPCRIVVEFPE